MDIPRQRYVGAGLGVFGLQSWAPTREPGQPVNVDSQSDKQSENGSHSSVMYSSQQQQQQRDTWSTVTHSLYTEHAANTSVSSPNLGKPY